MESVYFPRPLPTRREHIFLFPVLPTYYTTSDKYPIDYSTQHKRCLCHYCTATYRCFMTHRCPSETNVARYMYAALIILIVPFSESTTGRSVVKFISTASLQFTYLLNWLFSLCCSR